MRAADGRDELTRDGLQIRDRGAHPGRGAIADVMRAHDPRLGRDVALKILRHDDSELAERMLAEARIQAGIDHPNVCQVYETGRLEDGRPFIAMQLIEGRTWTTRFGMHRRSSPSDWWPRRRGRSTPRTGWG
jgi:serine/threonine protein kinase